MISEKWNDYITDQKQQLFEYRHLNDISYSKNLQKFTKKLVIANLYVVVTIVK